MNPRDCPWPSAVTWVCTQFAVSDATPDKIGPDGTKPPPAGRRRDEPRPFFPSSFSLLLRCSLSTTPLSPLLSSYCYYSPLNTNLIAALLLFTRRYPLLFATMFSLRSAQPAQVRQLILSPLIPSCVSLLRPALPPSIIGPLWELAKSPCYPIKYHFLFFFFSHFRYRYFPRMFLLSNMNCLGRLCSVAPRPPLSLALRSQQDVRPYTCLLCSQWRRRRPPLYYAAPNSNRSISF